MARSSTTDRRRFQRGDRLGTYRIESRIGHGGMGEVYRAWDERLERPVAIKCVRPPAAAGEDDPVARARLRREARAAARLDHPSIVRIYELLESPGGAGDAIVMEYIEGRTLRQMLRWGAFDVELALRLGREIAEGLAEAHGKAFVHRDLKASNVMITASGHARILDFGLVRPLERDAGETSLTASDHILGTAHALSPEQVRGEPVDARSDLFALGVLLYEMSTGARPFEGDSPVETLRQIVDLTPRSPLELRPDLPPPLAEEIVRLLAKQPDQRPSTARQVAAALTATLSTLVTFPGLEVVDPGRGLAAGSAFDVARANAAAEVVRIRVTPWPDGGSRVELRRLDGRSGSVL